MILWNLLRHPRAPTVCAVLRGTLLAAALWLPVRSILGQELALRQEPEVSAANAALDPWPPLPGRGVQQTGTLSCASTTCHGQTEEPVTRHSSRRNEYPRWLEHDPHARAAATLGGARFQRILAIVSSGRDDGAANAQVSEQCATCHDPQGLGDEGDAADLGANGVVERGTRGIGCESCHGAAEHWLSSHYQRGITRHERVRSGMLDLKNVVTRGRVCAACHVGDDRHDLNHDMLAAGHPPLRFELSAYHDLIRVKHWSESERIDRPDFKVHLWEAGQVSVADAMLGLLASRAERAAASTRAPLPLNEGDRAEASRVTPWPEFSEYDCFGCHQRLRPPADVNHQGATRVRGTPAWQPWNRGLLDRPERREGTHPNGPAPSASSDSFARLRQLMERRFGMVPAEVHAEAVATRMALRRHFVAPQELTSRELAGESSAEQTSVDPLERLLRRVEALPEIPVDWADASQRLLALKAVYLAIRDERQRSRLQTTGRPSVVDAGRASDTSEAASSSLRRFEELALSLGFGSREFEWPRYDWTGLPGDAPRAPHQDLASIGLQLRLLATELRTQVRPPPTRRSEGVRGL